jgi:hypothetical protein
MAAVCDVMKEFVHCPNFMENKELLLQQLGDKLVAIGWFAADSPGLRGTLDFLKQGSKEQIQDLTKAFERRLKEPDSCGRRQFQK